VLDSALQDDLKARARKRLQAAEEEHLKEYKAVKARKAKLQSMQSKAAEDKTFADIKAKLHKSIQALSDMGNKLHQRKMEDDRQDVPKRFHLRKSDVENSLKKVARTSSEPSSDTQVVLNDQASLDLEHWNALHR